MKTKITSLRRTPPLKVSVSTRARAEEMPDERESVYFSAVSLELGTLGMKGRPTISRQE